MVYERFAGTQHFLVAVNPRAVAAQCNVALPHADAYELLKGSPDVSLESVSGAATVNMPPVSFGIWELH